MLKAKNGLIKTSDGKNIPVSDVSIDLQTKRAEIEILRSNILQSLNTKDKIIGKHVRSSFTTLLIGSGDNTNPLPDYLPFYEFGGATVSSNTVHFGERNILSNDGSSYFYVGLMGSLFEIDKPLTTRIEINIEAGQFPTITFENVGIVSSFAGSSGNVDLPIVPHMCNATATLFGFTVDQIVRLSFSVDNKVENIETLKNCDKMAITEMNMNVEGEVLINNSSDFSDVLNRLYSETLYTNQNVKIGSGNDGNTIEIKYDVKILDTKPSNKGDIQTLTFSGKVYRLDITHS